MDEKPAKRRPRIRFRFSLRTLFLLVTILCCWLGYQLNWIRQRNAAAVWIKENGIFEESRQYRERLPSRIDGMGPYVAAPWSLRLLGEKGIAMTAILSTKVTDPQVIDSKAQEFLVLFPEADVVYVGPGHVCDWFRRRKSGGP